jgi:twitching motility protein PilT
MAHSRTIIEGNKARGMQSMDESIQAVLDKGWITAEEAYMKASDKKRFVEVMEAEAAAKAAEEEAAEK